MTSQQNNFGVIHQLYADKKSFWDLSPSEIFTGLSLSLHQIKQGGGFVNAAVRKQAESHNQDTLQEHIDAKTGKPYLRVLFTVAMPKNKLSDLSIRTIRWSFTLYSRDKDTRWFCEGRCQASA